MPLNLKLFPQKFLHPHPPSLCQSKILMPHNLSIFEIFDLPNKKGSFNYDETIHDHINISNVNNKDNCIKQIKQVKKKTNCQIKE